MLHSVDLQFSLLTPSTNHKPTIQQEGVADLKPKCMMHKESSSTTAVMEVGNCISTPNVHHCVSRSANLSLGSQILTFSRDSAKLQNSAILFYGESKASP